MLTTRDDRRPFLSAPNAKRYFAATACEEARRRIVRSIARQEGPALVVGAVGVGKSLMLAVLAEQFASRMAVVTLPGAQLCTRRALLQVILYELGLPYRGLDEGELRLTLLRHLRGIASTPASTMATDSVSRHRGDAVGAPAPRRLLLLVDEADSLPVRLLEELRALTNIAIDGAPLVSLVLAGSPILEERFADPQLEAFSQRIAARAYLAPMGREETFQFVRAQVAAVGLKPDKLFAPDALEAVYSATGGVPRLVNQLGDQAMWMAEETECTPLDAALVQQAWSELQQLPAPWNTAAVPAASTAAAVDVVEFGELDSGEGLQPYAPANQRTTSSSADADDELPASIPIGAGRAERAAMHDRVGEGFSALEDSLELLDDLDDIDDAPGLLRASIAPEPAPEPPAPPAALNPFAESFVEEEPLVDRYFDFETQLLKKAPQVRNRIDPHFAAELGRCALAFTPPSERATLRPEPSAASARLAAPADPVSRADLLIVDDDDDASLPGAVVPARQFRGLFTRLASNGALA